MERSDAELVTRTLEGDGRAFGDLVRRYQGVVYGLAYHRLRSFADAQDVAQEAFVRAFRNLTQLQDRACFAAWLRAIAVNECRIWLRRRAASRDRGVALLPDDRADGGEWAQRQMRAVVRQAVEALGDKHRLVVELYYLAGHSCREVAEFLAVPVSTVEQRLSRARAELREEMMGKVEQGLTGHRLSEGFVGDVLRELSLSPGGWVTTAAGDGVRTMLLGAAEGGLDVAMLALTMRTADQEAIQLGPFEGGEAPEAKGRALDCAVQVMEAFGIRIQAVVLRLDPEGRCRAAVAVRRARTKRTLDLRPSDALALAARQKAPIYASEETLLQGKLGEDGLPCAIQESLDAWRRDLRAHRGRTEIEGRAFEMGLCPEEGRGTVRYHRDPAEDLLVVTVPGGDTRRLALHELGEGVEALWDAARRRAHEAFGHNRREYRSQYALEGEDAVVRFTPASGGRGADT